MKEVIIWRTELLLPHGVCVRDRAWATASRAEVWELHSCHSAKPLRSGPPLMEPTQSRSSPWALRHLQESPGFLSSD